MAARLEALDWPRLEAELHADGFAPTGPLLDAAECAELAALYDEPARFRSEVIMARHGFGRGAYRYFADPLPEIVSTLRRRLYPHLAPVANLWAERLGAAERYPPTLEDFSERCRAAGQSRPTPLLLRYGPGDYNCLHQDLYGDVAFPVQLVVLLSEPGVDFEGGEIVLVEQRPRAQSRAHVVVPGRGEGVLFTVNRRPAEGARGYHRRALRHGVSRVRRGTRLALGVIFHDAR